MEKINQKTQDLIRRIKTSNLKSGEKISVSSIQRKFSVSNILADKAFTKLKNDNWIRKMTNQITVIK